MRDQAVRSLRELNEVVERLRAPGGCPWDREQSHHSLRPYLLEEAYETLEAIEAGSAVTLAEELGDVLLQVLMHCAIAQEAGAAGFDIGDVAEGARRKMVGRHPHVFADREVTGAAEVMVNWERLKTAEKADRMSLLDGVPAALPALAFALGVQRRPARVGFDMTPSWPEALAAVRQALDAAASAAGALDPTPGPGPDGDAEEAVGDLLFAVVALARRLRVSPEDALRRRAARFADRFRQVESQLRSGGGDVHATSAADWSRRWREGQTP